MIRSLNNELIQLVEGAGTLLLQYWPGNKKRERTFEVIEKKDGTKVTSADLATNKFLLNGLKKVLPRDFGVISEESTPKGDEYDQDYTLIMDPLDGTHAFIDGRSDFSVLLGIVQRGVPVAGYMNFPALEVTASFCKGHSPLINGRRPRLSENLNIGPEKLFLRKCPDSADSRVYTKPMDSGYALLQLAQGKLDAVVIRMLTHREWDLVAPVAILNEIGAMVSDEHEQEISFSKPGIDFEYFIASNGNCHDEVVDFIWEFSR